MIADAKRKLRSGSEYNALIPKSTGKMVLRYQRGTTDDTITLMKEVTLTTLHQTKALAPTLKGSTLYETCKKIWNFVYDHIQYEKDRPGCEDIRHPSRIWADRTRGVDCDDYSVFVGSILMNLGIPFKYRITAYGGEWQHVYVIVPTDGRMDKNHDTTNDYITVDCVPDSFDYEVPYTKKKDVPMIPTYELSGLPDDLGRTAKRQARIDKRQEKKVVNKAAQKPGEAVGKQRKIIFGKALQKVTRGVTKVVASPVRSAWLMAMKINFKRVATRLRWAYASIDVVQRNGIDPARHQAIIKNLLKIQTIFHGVGGEAKNLKNAILKGAGNKDKKVPLSGIYGLAGARIDPEFEALPTIQDLAGINGLGIIDPATLASLGVIAAALAELAKNLDKILPATAAEGGEDESYANVDDEEYEMYADSEYYGYEGIGKIKLFAKKKGKDEPSKPLVAAAAVKPVAPAPMPISPIVLTNALTTSVKTAPTLPSVVAPTVAKPLTKKEARKEKKVVRVANRLEKKADRKVKKVPGQLVTNPELVAKAQDDAQRLTDKQQSGAKLSLKEKKQLVAATAVSKKAVAVAQNPDLAKSKKQVRQENRADRKVAKKPITTATVENAQSAKTILTEKAQTGSKLSMKEKRDLRTADAVLKKASSKPDTVLPVSAAQPIPTRPKLVQIAKSASNILSKAVAVSQIATEKTQGAAQTAQQVQRVINTVIEPTPTYLPQARESADGYDSYEDISTQPLDPAADTAEFSDGSSLVPEGDNPKKSGMGLIGLGIGALLFTGMLLSGQKKERQGNRNPRKASKGLSGTPATRKKATKPTAPIELW